ncbi:Glutarate-semialdehyde dehydrogenase DavD [Pseudovibrio axinellae]|uniref:Glutarate-semialdehyde dehydrogenase DavD n=1 Tax=Pseudovibrio axinellae TaxID=989403 RepID=A0A165TYM9_9HYPH|nr:NAD-dependent succinate-semialdehyde dehydrogenase [Pseudovibrio axinellae]KZL08477.1 Glutarate-semialdehyde dehydrogenase DavD [Pseudovibrio axinellae]SEP75369.1 succinate-semialdehyde dehydrogenase / glutarate-semialdehyde dehydrogenase [Pseudovibrio axinellae]
MSSTLTAANKVPLLREACLIGGTWLSGDEQNSIAVTNPATGEIIGRVPRFGRAETAQAIDAASKAFQSWSKMTAVERCNLMHSWADLIIENQTDLAKLLTIEMGKPLAEAAGEVTITANYIRFFAEEGKRVYGDVIPSPWQGRRIFVTKEPIGVVGAITPWNFPSSMLGRKLAAALGSGCTVVAKPASQTPYSALVLGKLAEDAGIPAGVINIITGTAAEIADELCENDKVRKITFTGSTPVGKQLASKALANMKKVSMELGGNAPFIVFDTANIDKAVEGAIASKFRNSGQTCVCANRIYVQSGVYEEFSAKLKVAIEVQLRVGNGLKAGVTQGPLIDSNAVAKVEELISDAVEKGGTVVTGGKRDAQGGTFFEPTLLLNATPDMKVAKEETFGPFAPVFKFESEEEAINMANDTEYGLACYFYTQDLGQTFRVMDALEYGLVGVNEGVITTEYAPFGGYKDSGMGNEGSKYGIDDYINIKYSCIGGLSL